MKGVTKIALAVALVAIVALSIVVASVAWFTSNPQVNANDVTLNASRTLIVSFDSKSNTDYRYDGQIGNAATGDDAPYVYEAGGFNVRIEPSGNDKRGEVKVEFGTVTIRTKVPGMETISGVLLTDLFHVEANVYTQVKEGMDTSGMDLYVKDATHNHFRAYDSTTDSALTQYYKFTDPLTIANDGTLKDSGGDAVLFPGGAYELAFTYTFLPESAYQVWLAATQESDYESIYGYKRAFILGENSYIGVIGYTEYNAKYHYGLPRYAQSGESGHYVYTANADGGYVKVVTGYQAYGSVTKYDDSSGSNIVSNGTYIKVDGTDEYVLFSCYDRVIGFPYSDDMYRGETFTFKVNCSVEEVDYVA